MLVAEYRIRIHAPDGTSQDEVAGYFAELEYPIASELQCDLESLIGNSVPLSVAVEIATEPVGATEVGP